MGHFLHNGVTGHRGDPQHHPENTLEAFDGAMTLGCDWVETDLRLTRDGRVVLCHDDNTGNYANEKRRIADIDFSALRQLNMAESFNMAHDDRPPRFAAIPTLEETLELFRGQDQTHLSLQPKDPGSLQAAAKIIRDMDYPEELLGFNDGDLALMTEARMMFPSATIFYDLYQPRFFESDLAAAKHAKFQAIVVFEGTLTPNMTARIAEAGFAPGVWNVDNPGELDRFINMGVKRFYTNVPKVLLEKLSQKSEIGG